MIVVLDTNVFISATIRKSGPSAQILKLFKKEQITLAVSEPIIAEIEKVLSYPRIQKRHKWPAKKKRAFVELLKMAAIVTPGKRAVKAIADDPSDNKFLTCAIEAKANAIVSGDEHLLELGSFKSIPILTPRQFVNEIKHLKQAA